VSWRTRAYRREDVAPVAELLAGLGDDSFRSRVGGALHAYYQWKYGDAPGEREQVRVALGREGLVGVVAMVERRVSLGGRIVRAFEMGDISTGADHRRQGVFSTLGREACAAAAAGAFTYVKPNAESAPVLLKQLGFSPLLEMATLARPLRVSSILARRLGRPALARRLRGLDRLLPLRAARDDVRVTREVGFGGELDALWDAVAAEHPAIVVRDRAYLRWRFEANPTPYFLLAARDARGRLQGYAVGLVTAWGAARIGYLVDILARREDARAIHGALIDGVLRACARGGAQAVHTWIVSARGSAQAGLRRALRSRGFFARGRGPVLWRPALPELPRDPRDWYFTMGDFDGI
jgi:hypothetical protein